MALKIYKYNPLLNIYSAISQGTFDAPISTSHDGLKGETVEQKLFVRNDDAGLFYETVTVEPQSTTTNITSGTSWLVKLSAGDSKPADWDEITTGESISIGDIGDSGTGDTTYKPFWLYVKAPEGSKAQTITDISLLLEFATGTVI